MLKTVRQGPRESQQTEPRATLAVMGPEVAAGQVPRRRSTVALAALADSVSNSMLSTVLAAAPGAAVDQDRQTAARAARVGFMVVAVVVAGSRAMRRHSAAAGSVALESSLLPTPLAT